MIKSYIYEENNLNDCTLIKQCNSYLQVPTVKLHLLHSQSLLVEQPESALINLLKIETKH